MERFDAFMSYSHAVDGQLAPAVQAGLQRLAKRMFSRRALRVFRDQTGLSTNPHLWAGIEEALLSSEWFVLLASPEAASSNWVDREVSTWLEARSLNRLMIVLTDGHLIFTAEGRVDTAQTDCLPPQLVAAVDHEPRWLDLRWAREDAQLDLRNGRFRAAVADLAAPMHGVAKDELEGEDVARQRQARRLAFAGIAAISVLALVAAATAVIALDQRRQAEAQRNEAVTQRVRADEQTTRATARGLAAQAAALADTDIDLSLLLAVEGYAHEPSIDTETGLLTALEGARMITSLDPGLPADTTYTATSPDRRSLYVLTQSGEVQVFATASLGEVERTLVSGIPVPAGLVISRDGPRLAVSGANGATVVDTADGTVLLTGVGGQSSILALSADGLLLAVALFDEPSLQIYDVATGTMRAEVESSLGIPEFLDDDLLAVHELGGTVMTVYRLEAEAASVERVVDELPPGGGLLLSPDGSALLAGGLQGTAVLLDTTAFEPLGPPVRVRGSRTGEFAFNPDGSLAALSADDGSVTVIATDDSSVVTVLTGLSGPLTTQFTGASSLVSVSTNGYGGATWDVGGTAIGAPQTVDGYIPFLRTLDDGASVVFVDEDADEASIVVAPADAVGEITRRRPFGWAISAFDVSAAHGLIAVSALDVDQAAQQVIDRRLHIATLADLSDVTVIPMGENAAEGVAFSPDGKLVAVGLRDGRLAVFDVASGDAALEPIDLDQYPCCLASLVWSPDGSMLFTGGQDGHLRTLDTSTWQVLDDLLLADSWALRHSQTSADESQIIVPVESGEIFLVDVASGDVVGDPFIAAGTQLQRASLFRDGTVLAAQSRDGKLRLWDVATRRPIGPALNGHGDYSQSAEAIDELTLISGGADGRVITWDLAAEAWAEQACELAGRNLTQEEWALYVGGAYRVTCGQWPADS